MLPPGWDGGDRRPETGPLHQAGRLRRGTGGELQGSGQVLLQPETALAERLGVGEHLADGWQLALR